MPGFLSALSGLLAGYITRRVLRRRQRRER
jgi:hypothetical protein